MNAKRALFVFGQVILMVILSRPTQGADKFGVCGLKFGPAKLRTACELLQDAKIGWHRGVLRWNEVMDDEGNLNFEKLDQQIKITLNKNIEIILTLRSVYELFAPDSGKLDLHYKKVWRSAPPDPIYMENYRSFVKEIVERYDGDGVADASFVTPSKNIKFWQIEFEPGRRSDRGSNYWKGTAGDYAALFLVAHDVIKTADPSAYVTLSAFTYGTMNYYRHHGDSFAMEVLTILDAQGGDFDIFDFHFYKGYERFLRINKYLRIHLDAIERFRSKPVWITETNVDKTQLAPDLTIEEYNSFVAKDIVKRYCVYSGRNIQKVFWFNFCDKQNATWRSPMKPKDFERFTGLTDRDLNPKPVYYTYKLLSEKLNGKKNVRRLRSLEPDDDTWIYKFGIDDRAVYVLWYDNPDLVSSQILLPLPWDQVLITHVITEPGITEPRIEASHTPNGELPITLTDSPVFLEKYTAPTCDFCDLNQDGVCNAGDLGLFGDSYGWGQFDCGDPEVYCLCDLNRDGACNELDGVLFREAYELPQCGE